MLENEPNDDSEESSGESDDAKVVLRVDCIEYVINNMDNDYNWINFLYVNNEAVAYEEPLADDINGDDMI